jgi:hypothetical protein
MCPSDEPNNEDAECSELGDAEGWIVFVDVDNNCERDSSNDDEELLRGEWFGHDSVRVDSNGGCISFASTGFLQPEAITGVEPARNTIFCDARGKNAVDGATMSAARGVLVGQTGRARVTRDISTSPSAPQDLRSGEWPDCP